MPDDEIDQALLRLLRANARMPAAELARAVNLSRTTVQSRLERLERSGVIEGYTLRLGEAARAASLGKTVISTWARSQPRRAASPRRTV